MVTAVKKQAVRFVPDASGALQSVDMLELYGLSTDTKPTQNVSNASCFVEMDTGSIYLFDEENAKWLKFAGGDR